jgi:hypothetical protein
MTNVSFFRAFAADTTTVTAKNTEYYFEHSREDYSNLYDGESPDDDQIKMFHYTDDIDVIKNESNRVEAVEYKGSVLMLVKSGMDEVIDVQMGGEKEKGKYELYVKPMIEGGGIVKYIIDYNSCTDVHDLDITDIKEVYNMIDFNGDGIWFKYTLKIFL